MSLALAMALLAWGIDRAVAQMPMPGPGQPPRYFSHPNYANSPLPMVDPATGAISGGIRKFVDGLPGLGPSGANNLGQYLSIAVPDTTTYPGSDYYEIAVVEYIERMHSDLPHTKLRGYVQLETSVTKGGHHSLGNGYFGVDKPHYLGPTIVATKNRPVRILFRNLLPTGQGGNLFVPVDTTVMGSGMGPALASMEEMDPQNPMCGQIPKPDGCFTENRATLHLHGGISPWISDGTPHQWITPAGERPYPDGSGRENKGVSVAYVPDMWFDASGNTIASCAGQTTCSETGATNNPGPGAQTFYYPNQQSARLMFYHDHSWGITRLNVYVGEAAGYVITDSTEQMLVDQGIIPGPTSPETIYLVIQDKTFVPNDEQLMMQDETWDKARWGGLGSLWLPHVYSPAQNPGDSSGINEFGRWMYGPWFWPPTNSIKYGPIANPYYDPACDPDMEWCEPPFMPGTPYNSMGMEAFMDTPVVNGTAYPTVTLEPKTYRLRILNAANDRFFNLSLYEADPANPTEVALNAAEVLAAKDDPFVVFPTPDESISPKGPNWIMIGTEGGFLPAPVVIPAQVTTWVTDPTVFNAGNVDKHSLLLGPAERADVIVDFSAYAGKTLILYNDAPAAFPARDPRYDYYTDSADLTGVGGVPPILPGYGPNTRTIMQIKIEGTSAQAYDLDALQTAFKSKSLGGRGVFEDGQHPIIVGQGAYNSAYGKSFQTNGPYAGLARIFDQSLTFDTLSGNRLTIPFQNKQIQDEMGEAFEQEYGRMSGFLGLEVPNAQAGLQNMILYPYVYPPTEVIDASNLPRGGVSVTPIATANDGTQIWKITHNGVDTHPIHFHLYEVQLLNRVGWDGIIRRPHPSELGWKDTLRISPLEDTIVALRPVIPDIPFDLPNSIRLLDPSKPEGAYIANTTLAEALGLPLFAFNPDGEPVDIINHYVNFGWEYVWHCHILSHEEMDMMRSQIIGIPPKAPSGLVATRIGNGNNRRVDLTWTDNSKNETAFLIQRANNINGPWTDLVTLTSATGPAVGQVAYTDPIGNTNQTFYYRVKAINVVGDTWDYSNPAFNEIPPGGGFPTLSLQSAFSNTATFGAMPPAAPSNLSASAFRFNNNNDRVTLTWTDNSNNETGFTIQRATNETFSAGLVTSTVGANVTTFTTGNLPRFTIYWFRVAATNAAGASDWSNVVSVTTP